MFEKLEGPPQLRSESRSESQESRDVRLEHIKKKIREWVSVGFFAFASAGGVSMEAPKQEYLTATANPEAQQRVDLYRKKISAEKLKKLEEMFTDDILLQLGMNDALARDRSRIEAETKTASPVILHFDELGFSNDDMCELLSEKFYPKGSVNGNVGVVQFQEMNDKDNDDIINGKYNLSAHGFETIATTDRIIAVDKEGKVVDNRKQVTIYGASLKDDFLPIQKLESISWLFNHELGHLLDWANNNHLSLQERTQFLYEIAEAFKAPGAFRDVGGYVEDINNADKQLENYYKVSEWWGTLCEYYFTFPEDMRILYPKEFALTERWAKKLDPGFDPEVKAFERSIYMNDIARRSADPSSRQDKPQ